MTTTRETYEKYDFVKRAIDIMATSAGWKSGEFRIPHDDFRTGIDHNLDEGLLSEIGRQMLLDGAVRVDAKLQNEALNLEIISEPGSAANPTKITRKDTSFDEPGQPLLRRISDQIDIYEKYRSSGAFDPQLERVFMDTFRAGLGLPPVGVGTGEHRPSPTSGPSEVGFACFHRER